MHSAGRATLLLVCALALPGQRSPFAPEKNPYTISVDVNVVQLQVTVRDRKGGFVPDLTQSDFTVYEDGVPQEIRYFRHQDVPVTAGLVVDDSGSMRAKRAAVTAAAVAFEESSNPADQMFAVNFNEHVKLGLPPRTTFTDSAAELGRALAEAPPTGMTALYDAIAAGLDHLKLGTRDKKVLIVVSDGGDNASRLKLSQVLARAEESNASIYTIGVFDEGDPDQNPGVLKKLAAQTGGEAFLPHNLDEVKSICQRIAREIRHQYTIGYVPSNAKQDGTYRTIRVAIRAKNHGRLLVRTREGYRAVQAP